MPNSQQFFHPDHVDEQVEQFLQAPTDPSVQLPEHSLVQGLANNAHLERRSIVLDNAWKRIQEQAQHKQQPQLPPIIDVRNYQKGKSKTMTTTYPTPTQQESPVQNKRPRPRFSRRFVVLIAAVVALVVILSAAALPIVESMINGLLQQEAEIPLSAYTDVHQVQTAGDFKIYIEKAYADSNRVLLAYHISGPAEYEGSVIEPLEPTVTASDQNVSLSWGSEGTLANAAKKSSEGTSEAAGTWSFDASTVKGSPENLHIHMTMNGLTYVKPDATPDAQKSIASTTVKGQLVYDFAVPFHAGRVATPHQAVTQDGRTVTLERVVVTQSETHLYVRGLYGLNTDVKLFGEKPTRSGGTITHDCIKPTDPKKHYDFNETCLVSLNVMKDYSDKQGEWTVDLIDEKGTTWTFHFTVPSTNK